MVQHLALIERLIAEVTRPESVYRVGDFTLWDNRYLLHRGYG